MSLLIHINRLKYIKTLKPINVIIEINVSFIIKLIMLKIKHIRIPAKTILVIRFFDKDLLIFSSVALSKLILKYSLCVLILNS